VLNAGAGAFGLVDPTAGCSHALAFLPGFARGLALHVAHARIGLSLPRSNQVFAGLPLEDRLQAGKIEPQCALVVVDIASGQALHRLRLGGVVRKLYDVALLPKSRRPMLVGTRDAGPLNRMIRRGAELPLGSLGAPG
jgi:uncharacterized protein (TIGR03032 family)